jgi:hypothetical protein
MGANDYRFITRWQVEGAPDEVWAVLGDAAGLARWWPSVYLDVRVEEPGDERGLGRVVSVWTKGFLPYTLRWRFTVNESDPPHGFALHSVGDFVGRGVWTIERAADGDGSLVTYDWRITAEKGVLRRFSAVLKPVFAANHRWAMARGEVSLRLELARRRANGDRTLLAAIPDPPGPTFPHNLRLRRAARDQQ